MKENLFSNLSWYALNLTPQIYDSKKNTLWLGLFKTKGDKNSGPVTDLWFENEKDVNISINIRIKVSNEGIFKGVMQEGKMITIDEWNAKFK